MVADEDPRLDDYLDEWLERRRSQLRPSTLRCYRQTVDCYLRPHLGDVRLSVLDRRQLERFYARLLASGGSNGRALSPRTVQLAHAVLHRALKDAQLDGLLTRNPAALARTPRRDPYAIESTDGLQVWSEEEAGHFLDEVEDHPWRCLWHLALGTGARRGELLGLRWQDVDLDAARVTVRRALTVIDGVARLLGTKTSQARTLAIGGSLVTGLRREQSEQAARRRCADQWHDPWGLVLTGPSGEHLDPMAVTREFRRLVRTIDVPVIRLHDLRHTHASLLLTQGAPAKVVSDRLGHTTIAMTMDIYAHLLPVVDQDAASRLDASLRGKARNHQRDNM